MFRYFIHMGDQEDKSESVEWSQDTIEIEDPDGYTSDDVRDYDDTPPSIERERTKREMEEIEDRNKSLELWKAEEIEILRRESEKRRQIQQEEGDQARAVIESRMRQLEEANRKANANYISDEPVVKQNPNNTQNADNLLKSYQGGRRKRPTKKSKKTKKTKKTKKSKKSNKSRKSRKTKRSKKSRKSKK